MAGSCNLELVLFIDFSLCSRILGLKDILIMNLKAHYRAESKLINTRRSELQTPCCWTTSHASSLSSHSNLRLLANACRILVNLSLNKLFSNLIEKFLLTALDRKR